MVEALLEEAGAVKRARVYVNANNENQYGGNVLYVTFKSPQAAEYALLQFPKKIFNDSPLYVWTASDSRSAYWEKPKRVIQQEQKEERLRKRREVIAKVQSGGRKLEVKKARPAIIATSTATSNTTATAANDVPEIDKEKLEKLERMRRLNAEMAKSKGRRLIKPPIDASKPEVKTASSTVLSTSPSPSKAANTNASPATSRPRETAPGSSKSSQDQSTKPRTVPESSREDRIPSSRQPESRVRRRTPSPKAHHSRDHHRRTDSDRSNPSRDSVPSSSSRHESSRDKNDKHGSYDTTRTRHISERSKSPVVLSIPHIRSLQPLPDQKELFRHRKADNFDRSPPRHDLPSLDDPFEMGQDTFHRSPSPIIEREYTSAAAAAAAARRSLSPLSSPSSGDRGGAAAAARRPLPDQLAAFKAAGGSGGHSGSPRRGGGGGKKKSKRRRISRSPVGRRGGGMPSLLDLPPSAIRSPDERGSPRKRRRGR